MGAFLFSGVTLNTAYAIDNFVLTSQGEAIRLLPFGPLYKNGKRRDVTPELAAKFSLPHFKPPIKLGSHEDATPAGGFIVGLEVRSDGLYGLTEWTDKGAKASAEGDYRYQSPEIIWSEMGLEDPATGDTIKGPLIVGTALLHTPHLGEAAALYTAELEELSMTDTVNVPVTFFDKVMDFFTAKDPKEPKAPEAPPAPVAPEEPQVEQFEALQQERDNLAAELATLKAEREAEQRSAQLVTELQDAEKFGAMFVELSAAEEAAGFLRGMTTEQQEWVLRNFSALAKQVSTGALFGEQGSTGEGTPADPFAALTLAVNKVAEERKIDFSAALTIVAEEQPALVEAAYK